MTVIDVEARHGRELAIEPFRTWVEEVYQRQLRAARLETPDEHHAITTAKNRTATLFGISRRTLYRWRQELTVVYEITVDRACCYHGSVHINELYPELGEDLGAEAYDDAA